MDWHYGRSNICHCLLKKKYFTWSAQLAGTQNDSSSWWLPAGLVLCSQLLETNAGSLVLLNVSRHRALMLVKKKNSIMAPSKSSLRLVRSTAAVSMSRGQLALTLAVRDRVIGHVTLLPCPRPRRCHQQFAAPCCVLRPLTTCTPVGQVVCEPNNE